VKTLKELSELRKRSELCFFRTLNTEAVTSIGLQVLLGELESRDTFYCDTVRIVLLKWHVPSLTRDQLQSFLLSGNDFVCDKARMDLLMYYGSSLPYVLLLSFLSSKVVSIRGKSEEYLNKVPTRDMNPAVLLGYLVGGDRDVLVVIKKIFSRFERHQLDRDMLFEYHENGCREAAELARALLVQHFRTSLTEEHLELFLQKGGYDVHLYISYICVEQ